MKLALGSAQFGLNYGISNNSGVVKLNEIKKIISYAKKNNVNYIDTAPAYGNSQKKLGKINLNKFRVITKLPKLPKDIKKNKIGIWIESTLKTHLNDLKIKNFYAILMHNPDDLLSKSGIIIFKKLRELKKKKLFLKIGAAVYTTTQLENILKKFKLDLINFPFSVGNTKFLNNNLLSLIKKRKSEIHIRSVFMQGLLLIKNKSRIPKKLKNTRFLENWHMFLKKNKIDPLEGCIQFIKLRKEFNVVIIGVDNLDQFKQIIKFFNEDKIIDYPKILNKYKYSNISKW